MKLAPDLDPGSRAPANLQTSILRRYTPLGAADGPNPFRTPALAPSSTPSTDRYGLSIPTWTATNLAT